jgi:hypothetical protein
MIKETLAFLLENSCSEFSTLILETLNLQSSWTAPLLTSHKHRTGAQQQTNKQEELRTSHQKKRKLKKNILKDKARCYGHESERNAEDGTTVVILGRYLLTIISVILFQNKGFVQIITQRSYLIIGSGHKDRFER